MVNCDEMGSRNSLFCDKTDSTRCQINDRSYRDSIRKIMNEIIERLKQLIKNIEGEQGPLLIFALFLREDSIEKWDIIISAAWLNSNEMESYKLISGKLQG